MRKNRYVRFNEIEQAFVHPENLAQFVDTFEIAIGWAMEQTLCRIIVFFRTLRVAQRIGITPVKHGVDEGGCLHIVDLNRPQQTVNKLISIFPDSSMMVTNSSFSWYSQRRVSPSARQRAGSTWTAGGCPACWGFV